MKSDRTIWRVGFLYALAGSYKLLERVEPAIPFLHTYFEDLIAVPLILGTALILIRKARQEWSGYTISLRDVIILCTLFTFYFEVLLPRFSVRFIADPLDAACYVIGAALFQFWINVNVPVDRPVNTSE